LHRLTSSDGGNERSGYETGDRDGRHLRRQCGETEKGSGKR
jgi:hypothetical protein